MIKYHNIVLMMEIWYTGINCRKISVLKYMHIYTSNQIRRVRLSPDYTCVFFKFIYEEDLDFITKSPSPPNLKLSSVFFTVLLCKCQVTVKKFCLYPCVLQEKQNYQYS
jgi:hypothetical protein